MIRRRASIATSVGGVRVGGGAPIVVQSMTNTDTADIDSTVAQVRALARAGSELVRITVNSDEAAAAVPHIRDRLDAAFEVKKERGSSGQEPRHIIADFSGVTQGGNYNW